MSLCNLTKVLGFLPILQQRPKLSTNPGNRYCTYAKRAFEDN